METHESLELVVAISSGDGVLTGVADGGSWVTIFEGVGGGGSVGLMVRTTPEREIAIERDR